MDFTLIDYSQHALSQGSEQRRQPTSACATTAAEKRPMELASAPILHGQVSGRFSALWTD